MVIGVIARILPRVIPIKHIAYMGGKVYKIFTPSPDDVSQISKVKDTTTSAIKKAYSDSEQPGGGRKKQVNVGVVKVSRTKGVIPSETRVEFPGMLSFKRSVQPTARSRVEVSARPEVTSIPKQMVQSGSTTTMQRGPKVYTKLTTKRELSVTPFSEGPAVDMSRGFVYDVLPGRMKWYTRKAPTKREIFQQKKDLRESGLPAGYALHFDELDRQVGTSQPPALSFFFKSQTKASGFGGDMTTIDYTRSPTVHKLIDWRLEGKTRDKPYQKLRDDFYKIYGGGDIEGRYNLYTNPREGLQGKVKSVSSGSIGGPKIGRIKPRIKKKYVKERQISAGVESKPVGFTGSLTWKKVKGKKHKRSQLWLQGEMFGRTRGKRFEKKRTFKVPLPVETDAVLGGMYGGIPVAGLMTQDLSKIGPTFDAWMESLKR